LKLTFYVSVVVLLAGLAARILVGFPLPDAVAQKTAAPPATERVAYVDSSELLKLHPDWEALKEMKATLAEVRSTPGGFSFNRDTGDNAGDKAPVMHDARAGVSRKELEANAAQAATGALENLETEKREALDARLRSMRSIMAKNEESAVMSQSRDIEETAADQAKDVDVRQNNDLINARLKAAALQVQTKVSGIDQNAVAGELKKAQRSVDKISAATDAEKDRITTTANTRIDALRQANVGKIDEQIRAYQQKENARISADMAQAKEQIVREIGSFPTPGLGETRSQAGAPVKENCYGTVSGRADPGISRLKSATAELEIKIRKDVDRAVTDLAAKKGIKVVFSRRNGTPDATKIFADLLRKQGWSAFQPVLSELRSS